MSESWGCLHYYNWPPCSNSQLRPSMMQHLLRRLVFDVPLLNEHAKMPLKVNTGDSWHYVVPGSLSWLFFLIVCLLDLVCLVSDAVEFLLIIEKAL